MPHAMRKFHLLIAFAIVCLDRVAKLAISKNISLHESIQVIPGFFRITHVENRGAAFGLFADSPSEWKIAVLVLFSIVALDRKSTRLNSSHITISYAVFCLKKKKKYTTNNIIQM